MGMFIGNMLGADAPLGSSPVCQNTDCKSVPESSARVDSLRYVSRMLLSKASDAAPKGNVVVWMRVPAECVLSDGSVSEVHSEAEPLLPDISM